MNFLETLLDFLARFWPFDIVDEWEEGVFYFCGRAWRKKYPPGVYGFIPWFTRIETVSVVPTVISTPLLNITLMDGKTLCYSATAIVQVIDPWLALNAIDDYQESVGELVASRVSSKLASVDAERLDLERRGRLLPDLIRWLNQDTEQYGVTVRDLRFTNFAINQRAYRLLTDTALNSMVWD